MANKPTRAEQNLLEAVSLNEADRRAYIRSWLNEIGISDNTIRAEYQVEGGAIDLYLTNKRVIIEVKKSGRLKNGPNEKGTGSKHNEFAFEQLSNYVKIERKREKLYLENEIDDLDWIGIITDGRKWWIWKWSSNPNDIMNDGKQINEWQNTLLTENNIKQLRDSFFIKTVGKEWATTNSYLLFEDYKNELINAFKFEKDIRSTETQQILWLEQLQASGNVPEKDKDEIFILHTMLILIARMIPSTENISNGFVQWVPNDMLIKLRNIINKYNWKHESGDILRALYEYYIPVEHRRIYGEYYTPDWLAEKICLELIDDDYINKQIEKYNSKEELDGILDPCCGSGVFLYYATKVIRDSKPIKSLGESNIEEFICKLIYGIDIHPVAVEMARSNIRRLFPNISNDKIKIYQSDSLLIERPGQKLYGFGDEDLFLLSPKGKHLLLPSWFIKSINDVSKFTKTACSNNEIPPGLGKKLKGYDKNILKEQHDQLRNIVQSEGNGVWEWYINNQIGSINLRNKIGRIISNPPWVSYDIIQNKKRKTEIKSLANKLDLWVGAKYTKFDMGGLFVDRCMSIYLKNNGKASWVLTDSVMKGGDWKKFRLKLNKKIDCIWNIQRLAFPRSSCVVFFGVSIKSKTLLKLSSSKKINHYDTWNNVNKKTKWIKSTTKKYIEKQSEWFNKKNISLVRRGASIIPHCLIWIDKIFECDDHNYKITTKKSIHNPWRNIRPLTGIIPKKFVLKCLTSTNLLPYNIYNNISCIIPLYNYKWDDNRFKNKFWNDVGHIYEKYKGKGDDTPKTIEERLNYNDGLLNQLNRSGHYIIYNKSGKPIASRLLDNSLIVNDTLYYLKCKSKNEAYFIIAIINAEILLSSFQSTVQDDRGSMAGHIWKKIPIPRYNKNNEFHNKLVKLSINAEQISQSVTDTEISSNQMRKIINKKIKDDGLSDKIDQVCKKILPNYV